MKNILMGEGTHIQGFIEIEKINKKDHVREVYKNTITSGGKQFLLDKSAALMLGIGGDTFGKTGCTNMIGRTGIYDYNYSCRYSRSDRDITNVLLNLSENQLSGLGASTSFVNVFDSGFSVPSKVVGYANSDVIANADGKEGIMDYCKGEYMVDPYTVCKRWKYAEGVASGTINAIAMMPATCINDPYGDGIKFSKCLDKCNVQYQNYASLSTGFLIPGVPGYTGNDEILLNFTQDNNSRWKYNIGTGEITAVPSTDNFYVFDMTENSGGIIVDMQCIDGYMYVLRLSGAPTGSGRYWSANVYVYDPANSMNQMTYFSLNYNITYENPSKLSIFKSGNDLFIGVIPGYKDTNSGGYKLFKLNIGSGGYATSAGSGQTDYTLLGLTLPSGVALSDVGIGMYKGNYVLWMPVSVYNNVSANKSTYNSGNYYGYKLIGYVFTSLNDPAGSMIDMIPGVSPTEILFSAGSNAGTLRVGFDFFNTYQENGPGYVYDTVDARTVVMNSTAPSNTNEITVSTLKKGVYLTLDKWWTNIFSFVKLNTPVTKTASDIIYVSYGYKIV
jgi:hypothetical protein